MDQDWIRFSLCFFLVHVFTWSSLQCLGTVGFSMLDPVLPQRQPFGSIATVFIYKPDMVSIPA